MSTLDPWSYRLLKRIRNCWYSCLLTLFSIVFIFFRYNTKKIEKHTGQKYLTVNHSKEYKTAETAYTLSCFFRFFFYYLAYIFDIYLLC